MSQIAKAAHALESKDLRKYLPLFVRCQLWWYFCVNAVERRKEAPLRVKCSLSKSKVLVQDQEVAVGDDWLGVVLEG